MARGRKPAKRVRIEIELEMSDSDYRAIKEVLKDNIESAIGGKLIYLAIGAEDRE